MPLTPKDLERVEQLVAKRLQLESQRIQQNVADQTLQTLRAILIAIVAELQADPAHLALILAAQADNKELDPISRAMLADLSEGLNMMGSLGLRPN